MSLLIRLRSWLVVTRARALLASVQRGARSPAVRLVWLGSLLSVLAFGAVPGTDAMVPAGSLEEVGLLPASSSSGARDGALQVTVRTAGDAPLGGATVHAFLMRPEAEGEGEGRRAQAIGVGVTDAHGSLMFERLPHGEAWVLVDAPGAARASSHLVLEAGEQRVALLLAPAHAFDVDVKDEAGHPVPGAIVEALAGGEGGALVPLGARTDAQGHAHVGRLGAPPWLATVRARGYEETPLRVASDGAREALALKRLGAFLVRVEDEGRPVRGARVQIASSVMWPARVTETGDDGTVRIGGLEAGSYALRAATVERVSATELGVALARGEDKPLTLRLGRGEQIAVRALDGDGDGAVGVKGARVTLAEDGLTPFPIEGVTGKDGRVTLGPVAPGAEVVTVRAEGFVPRAAVPVSAALPAPSRSELLVSLVHAAVLRGRVVDTRGRPVDGATLQVVGTAFEGAPVDDDPRRAAFRDAHFAASLAGPKRLVDEGELGVMPGPVPPIPHGAPMGAQGLSTGAFLGPLAAATERASEPWVTRSDGTFTLRPITPGRLRVLVRHPQYVEAASDWVTVVPDAPAGAAEVLVTVRAGGDLDGRVVDRAGRAVANAEVTLVAAHGTTERVTRTGTDGTFAFAAVPSEVSLQVTLAGDPGHVAAQALVTVPDAGKQAVTLTLSEARGPLAVQVSDDRGYPVALAQVSAVSLSLESSRRVTAYTDARGEASLEGVRGLPLRVEVHAPGHPTAVRVAEAEAESLHVDLVPPERLTGLVRSARNGSPLAADVSLSAAAEQPSAGVGPRRGRADARGAFAFADLAPGPLRLHVRAAGFASKEATITVLASAGERPTVLPAIDLDEAGEAEGTVVDARGEPVPGARVAAGHVPTFVAEGTIATGFALTDARGRFHLRDLAEGVSPLEAYAPDRGRGLSPVAITAGRVTHDVRLVLHDDGQGPSPPGAPSPSPSSEGGVAITLGEASGGASGAAVVVVVQVAEGSEAERAGLLPDDQLLTIDGAPVQSMSDARSRLEGPLALDVLVTVARGERTLPLRIARERLAR